MTFEKIRFDLTDGIARIVFADAANHNAVNLRVTQEMAEAARRCEAASACRPSGSPGMSFTVLQLRAPGSSSKPWKRPGPTARAALLAGNRVR